MPACAEEGAPPFAADVCICNCYAPRAGSLGLHQDRSESAASIAAGDPVISISLGEAAVFVLGPPTSELGGAPPPPPECQFIRLYSGDVLVLGGESRLSFHGVKAVLPNTAPRYLDLPEKCRLNLTLRKY